MQLLRASEVQTANAAQVFRYSRLRETSLALLILLFAAFCIVLGREEFTGLARYASYYIGAMLLAGLFFFSGYVTARFRASNWLAQISSTGIFVKFRSYLNYALPDSDQTVVFIPYQDQLGGPS